MAITREQVGLVFRVDADASSAKAALSQFRAQAADSTTAVGAFFRVLSQKVREFTGGLKDGLRQGAAEFSGFEQSAKRAEGGVTGIAGGLANLRGAAAGLAALGVGTLFKSLAESSLQAAVEVDKNRQALATLTGGIGAANEKMAELRKLAAETPGATAGAAISLYTQLKATGEVVDATINKTIQSVSKLNAVFDLKEPQEFARNLVQIFSQGFERGDIKEAIGRVPIFEQLLQSAFGTTDGEKLKKLKDAGKLTLEGFLDGLNGAVKEDARFANIRESIGSQLAKAKDNVTFALAPIGDEIAANLFPILARLQPLIESAAAAITQQLRDSREEFGQVTDAAGNFLDALNNLAGQSGVTFSLQNEMRDVAALVNFVTGGIVLLQDVVELTAAFVVAVIKTAVLAIEATVAGLFDLFGIKIQSLNNDMRRLADDLGVINQRLDQGLKNTDAFYARLRQQDEQRQQNNIVVDVGNAVPTDPNNPGKPLNTNQTRPPIKPAATKTGGGGGSKTDQATQDALKLLRLREQAAQRIADAEIAEARRAFEFQQITIEQLTNLVIEAEKRKLAAQEITFAAERGAVEKSKLRAGEKAVKLAEIAEREATAVQRGESAIQQARDRRTQVESQVFEQASRARGERQEEELRQEIARIQTAADQRTITEEAAARRIAEIEEQIFQQRRIRLIAERTLAAEGSLERQKAADDLARLELERAAQVEAAQLRILEAQRKDLANLRTYLEQRNRLLEELRRGEVDALNRRSQDLQARASNNPAFNDQARTARQQALEAEEQFRNQLNLNQIARDRQAAEDAAKSESQKLAVRQLANQLEEQEEARHQEEMLRIVTDARASELQQQGFDGGAADEIALAEQSLGRVTTGFEQFQIGLSASIAKMKAELPSMAALFLQVSDQIAGALATNIAAFVSGAVSIRKAAAEFFKAALAPVKDYLLKKSKIQFAEAIASLAAQDYRGFALHSLAGAALAAAAGLIDAGGSAIAGSTGGTIAPAGAGGGGGNQQSGPRVIEQGDRQRETQVIVIRAEYQPGVIVREVTQDYRGNGATRGLLRGDMLGEGAG
jgi:hypothetical protein